jgi:hypothetical protein
MLSHLIQSTCGTRPQFARRRLLGQGKPRLAGSTGIRVALATDGSRRGPRRRVGCRAVTNRVVPGKLILGQLGDIEAGVRQMIRTRPLETTKVTLPSGRTLTVPSAEETLRIKGFLIVRRNQTRDYLDVAALADRYGIHDAAAVLARIDDYYEDQHGGGRGVAAQLTRQLADPHPKDASVTRQLDAYRNLAARWTDWDEVRSISRQLAAQMLESEV